MNKKSLNIDSSVLEKDKEYACAYNISLSRLIESYLISLLGMGKNLLLNSLKSKIQLVDINATVILFGSRSCQDNSVESDWDILVLTDMPEN